MHCTSGIWKKKFEFVLRAKNTKNYPTTVLSIHSNSKTISQSANARNCFELFFLQLCSYIYFETFDFCRNKIYVQKSLSSFYFLLGWYWIMYWIESFRVVAMSISSGYFNTKFYRCKGFCEKDFQPTIIMNMNTNISLF